MERTVGNTKQNLINAKAEAILKTLQLLHKKNVASAIKVEYNGMFSNLASSLSKKLSRKDISDLYAIIQNSRFYE